MWTVCFGLSIGCVAAAAAMALISKGKGKKKIGTLNMMLAGVFAAALFLFYPMHRVGAIAGIEGDWQAFLLSVFSSMQIFAIGADYDIVIQGIRTYEGVLATAYQLWAAVMFVLAPIFTFSFVLSLFKNISAHIRYFASYFRDVYVFSEVNEKSLVLAADLKKRNKRIALVFMDVFEGTDEQYFESMEAVKKLDAICFRKDVLGVNFRNHSASRNITFFNISVNETENLDQALKLIEAYKDRENTRLYVFSTKVESELLLTEIDKGHMRVRRINEVQSLINRLLYENSGILFDSALEQEDGIKQITALVIGMGNHGTEMVKALSWMGQMDGYRMEVHAFDKDERAYEKFCALAPELMSPEYNGTHVQGEAQYTIFIHPQMDVETITFVEKLREIRKPTYVMVALGDDDVNIRTAVSLRMWFERMGVHPVIQAIVYNTQQTRALTGVKNYRGQAYDIEFVGDTETSFSADVIMDSELEEDALERHLKWGKEEEFWAYEYNYRSSVATAIHMRARIKCGIPGADKREEELTPQEKNALEELEHRRWNAYMRAEGYIFSGSKEKSSRNDLGKMHHDLVDFSSLSEEEKRKDSRVGSK